MIKESLAASVCPHSSSSPNVVRAVEAIDGALDSVPREGTRLGAIMVWGPKRVRKLIGSVREKPRKRRADERSHAEVLRDALAVALETETAKDALGRMDCRQCRGDQAEVLARFPEQFDLGVAKRVQTAGQTGATPTMAKLAEEIAVRETTLEWVRAKVVPRRVATGTGIIVAAVAVAALSWLAAAEQVGATAEVLLVVGAGAVVLVTGGLVAVRSRRPVLHELVRASCLRLVAEIVGDEENPLPPATPEALLSRLEIAKRMGPLSRRPIDFEMLLVRAESTRDSKLFAALYNVNDLLSRWQRHPNHISARADAIAALEQLVRVTADLDQRQKSGRSEPGNPEEEKAGAAA